MSFFTKLGIDPSQASIDWDLQPADTFGMFESWGGKERVKNKNERFYYFYIDNWQPPARLFLMERGIKYARILATIVSAYFTHLTGIAPVFFNSIRFGC